MAGRRVSDHMTGDVLTLRESDTLRTALELELSRRIRHIPVLSAQGALVGIVTDRDIRRALPTPLSPAAPEEYESILDGTSIGRVMTREPYTIDAGADVSQAVRAMLDKKIGGLPVIKDGALAGMFTKSDALRGFLELLGERPRS